MGEKSELISVIIPMYNVEKYIESCIRSVMNQTYINIEIIVIDDGSPDESGNIADKLALVDKRIHVLHTDNQGVSAARNLGIQVARGDYLIFVDSDDYLSDDYIDYMLTLIYKSGSQFAMSKNCFLYPGDQLQVGMETIEIWNSEEASTKLLYPGLIEIGCWNKMFNRAFLLDNNIRFSDKYYMGEGLKFIVKASQCANSIVVGNRKVYHYRKDNTLSATTVVNVPKYKNAILALDSIFDDITLSSQNLMNSFFQHKCLTVYIALHTICVTNSKSEFISDYDDYLKFLRGNFLEMLISELPLKIKLKICMFCVDPVLASMMISKLKK
ncbi:glycosyltransferase family 2 protein [Photobacterium damselae]|uniref:glycosyltransferase family 2 protein n=1 Tax=Photobacterium damselae TaxID=38293 RepID=UPI0012489D6E|nr:glycosyltransferase family 2 protein [Photobacterium damselae]KAB1182952.1 glycosyltransferase family 2 protein [Photobacterium damselae subsp. damselae]MBF7101603.1 glycosyltransferase family 2 protein [Photobacterium damselae]